MDPEIIIHQLHAVNSILFPLSRKCFRCICLSAIEAYTNMKGKNNNGNPHHLELFLLTVDYSLFVQQKTVRIISFCLHKL